ncbi:MAG TPA: CoA transferase [Candidatus Saccharimonadales bacterium]|nr:CoA transferase [Candidatus Saccharimonadales bacterium]
MAGGGGSESPEVGLQSHFQVRWPPGGGAGGRPLSGVRVLELSRILAGPYCTMLLADLGADVIKVEPPTGDETRRWGPPFAGDTAAYFTSANRNKRSVVLDLKQDSGRLVLGDLVAQADVVVHNYTERVSTRLGIDREWLAGRNPNCIVCRISGFADGSDEPAYDLVLQAASGLMAITGQPEGPPTKVGVAVADVAAGMFAAIGVVAELFARSQGGQRPEVEVSILDSALALLVNQGASWLASGDDPQRWGNDHPSIVPYGLFPTGDGDLVLAVGSERQFGALTQVLGAPEMAQDPRFATNSRRVSNRTALRRVLEDKLSARGAEEWRQLLQPVGVPCGRVRTVAESLSRAADRLVIRMPRNGGPTEGQVMSPIRLDGNYLRPYRPAPDLGGEQISPGGVD